MADEFKVIQTSAIPQLTDVRFYAETVDHIKEEHGTQIPIDFPSVQGAVVTAVQSPTHVEQSKKPNHYVYVDARSTNSAGYPLRVPVKQVEGTSGLVKTAFFGEPDYEPKIIAKFGGDDE